MSRGYRHCPFFEVLSKIGFTYSRNSLFAFESVGLALNKQNAKWLSLCPACKVRLTPYSLTIVNMLHPILEDERFFHRFLDEMSIEPSESCYSAYSQSCYLTPIAQLLYSELKSLNILSKCVTLLHNRPSFAAY